MKADILIHNLREIATMAGGPPGPFRGKTLHDIPIVPDGAIAIGEGKIIAVGPSDEIRRQHGAKEEIDAEGRVATPGLVDAHTHLVYAGSREGEFEERIRGATYLEIASRGGGIRASVRAMREASLEDLVAQSLPRLRRALQHGTTTVEIKSGYGLDPDSEDRMLDAIRIVGERQPAEVIPTFLGAHEIPDDRRDDRAGYIREVIEEQMPRVRGKAVFCDVFCEEGVFTPAESRKILLAGKRMGFRPKVHAEEFAPTGGAEIAVEVGAASADHLEAISGEGIRALSGSDTIGVLLPGVSFYLGMEKKAPAREMIDRGVAVAVASDGNPGSSVTDSMQIILTLACVHLRMTPYEALAAATRNAAFAVGAEDRAGVLEAGRPADIVIWDMPSLRAIPHYYGTNLVYQVYKSGR